MSTYANLPKIAYNAFWDLYHNQLTERPKRFEKAENRVHSLGWVYVSNNCQSAKAVRTYQTLFALSERYTYYTPNTFYRRDSRSQGALRWLNAFVLDVDTKHGANVGICLPDLLDQIRSAGLPLPTMIVSTPSGGYHVYFVLDSPRQAFSNAVDTYNKLQLAIAKAIGADQQAVGAERYFRIPTEKNVIYRSERRIAFEELNDWYWLNHEPEQENAKTGVWAQRGLLQREAVQALLQGVERGKRDNTAYTLALVYKAEGYDQGSAEDALYTWNARLDSPLPERVIFQKVRSAYKPGAPAGPTADWIQYLSGVSFAHAAKWEAAKPRAERERSHYEEWAADVLEFLREQPDQQLSGSQRKLAASFGMSLSTFQEVVCNLVQTEKVILEVSGKGRAACTTLRLVRPKDPTKTTAKIIPFPKQSFTNNYIINVPVSNTFKVLGGLVGGFSPGRLLLLTTLPPPLP
ncbi:primase C-terminal domain-containing protein [Paenibacillus polymyxa]|uniref:primase C-terminal domain-containing protein n=1 Tax=Paenibacillus polymyxa TaxID=1406 RepID=UPI00211D2D96|nr:primase C-terminal domain-containing protein [Paenibacillus polymyxa]